MPDTSPNLSLPYIIAAQAQKHLTHNEAIRALDAIVQLGVEDRDLATPPASPAEGASYIVAAGAGAAWIGHEGNIAAFQDGAWEFYTPQEGWTAWVGDEDILVAWTGTTWQAASGPSTVNPVPMVGINASADAANRLTVAAPATLLNHEGAGHQLKVNKAAASDTGSLLFQTGFSGRAEMGLAGSDDFSFKVSPDGAAWNVAISIDRNTGRATAGMGLSLPDGNAATPAVAFSADPDTGLYRPAVDSLAVATGGVERARFTATGLGIGTTAPAAKLHAIGASAIILEKDVGGISIFARHANDIPGQSATITQQRSRGTTAAPTAVLANDILGTNAWHGHDGTSFGATAANIIALAEENFGVAAGGAYFSFRTRSLGSVGSPVERMRITANGDVGIGVTAPSVKLHVNGAIRTASYTVAALPSASALGAGAIVYCSNETGGATPVYSDGTNWRRPQDRAIAA